MRIKIIFAFIVILGLSACEKIMHQDRANLSDLSNEEEMNQALTGMYNRFAHMHQTFYFWQIIKGDDLNYPYYTNRAYPYFCIAKDSPPVDTNGQFVFCDELHGGKLGGEIFSENEKSLLIWQNIYTTIIMANNIIRQVEQKEMDPDLLAQAGEAYFVRSYSLYCLVRLFGKAPLVVDVDVKYDLPLASAEEIFLQIESDLKNAINLLPANRITARIPYSTPHRGTAKALLAEVYLCMGGYPVKDASRYLMAANFAGNVIDSADFYGYALLNDFADIWKGIVNKNSEAVFSLFYNPDYVGYGIGHNIGKREVRELIETLNLNFYKPHDIIVEVEFYNSFPKDYRRDISFYNHLKGNAYHLVNISGSSTKDTIEVLEFDHYYDKLSMADNIVYLKHHIQGQHLPLRSTSWIEVNNYIEKANNQNTSLYLFRYAHVLLTYAESKARAGLLDESAYEAVNQVRRRANRVAIMSPSEFDLTPGLTAEQFADSVVAERAWEFCGEYEGRWFDLIRLEMVEQLPNLRHPDEQGFPTKPVTKDDYYIPIPEEEAVWF